MSASEDQLSPEMAVCGAGEPDSSLNYTGVIYLPLPLLKKPP